MYSSGGRGSVVERLLAKEKVTSSNLVARSDEMAGSWVACLNAAIMLSAALFGDVAKR